MPRLFFGLEIPPEIKNRLLTVRSAVPGAKWQSNAQLHITLLFLGSVGEERLTAVCESASEIPIKPFSLQVTGLGCFGPPRKPRNLWADVQPAAPVVGLHQVLQEQMATLGPENENRTFRPHITLARFKREAGSVQSLLAEQAGQIFGQFPVTEIALFESKRGPTGSEYTVVERFSLRAPA